MDRQPQLATPRHSFGAGAQAIVVLVFFIMGFLVTESSFIQADLPAATQSGTVVADASCPVLNVDPAVSANVDAWLASIKPSVEPTIVELAQQEAVLQDQHFNVPDSAKLDDPTYQAALLAQLKDTYQTDWNLNQLQPISQTLPTSSDTRQIIQYQQTAATADGVEIPVENSGVTLIIGDGLIRPDTLINHYISDVTPLTPRLTGAEAIQKLNPTANAASSGDLVYYPVDTTDVRLAYRVTTTAKMGTAASESDLAPDPNVGTTVYIDATSGEVLDSRSNIRAFTDTPGTLPADVYYEINPKRDCEFRVATGKYACFATQKMGEECEPMTSVFTNPDSWKGMPLPPLAPLENAMVEIKPGILGTKPTWDFYKSVEDDGTRKGPSAGSDNNKTPYAVGDVCTLKSPLAINNYRHAIAQTNVFYHLTHPAVGVLGELSTRIAAAKRTPKISAGVYSTNVELRVACGSGKAACTELPKTAGDSLFKLHFETNSGLDTEIVHHELAHVYLNVLQPLFAKAKNYESAVLEEGLADFAAVTATMHDNAKTCTEKPACDVIEASKTVAACTNLNKSYYVPTIDPCKGQIIDCQPLLEIPKPTEFDKCIAAARGAFDAAQAALYQELWTCPGELSTCPQFKFSSNESDMPRYCAYVNPATSTLISNIAINWPTKMIDCSKEETRVPECGGFRGTSFYLYDYTLEGCLPDMGDTSSCPPQQTQPTVEQQRAYAACGKSNIDRYNSCLESNHIDPKSCSAASICLQTGSASDAKTTCITNTPDYSDTEKVGEYGYPKTFATHADIPTSDKDLEYILFQTNPKPDVDSAKVTGALLRFDKYLRTQTEEKVFTYGTGQDAVSFTQEYKPNELYLYPAIAQAVTDLAEPLAIDDPTYPLIPALYGKIYEYLKVAEEQQKALEREGKAGDAVITSTDIARYAAYWEDMLYNVIKAGIVVGNSAYVPVQNIVHWTGSCVAYISKPVYVLAVPPFGGLTASISKVTYDFIDPKTVSTVSNIAPTVWDSGEVPVIQKKLGDYTMDYRRKGAPVSVNFDGGADLRITATDIKGRTVKAIISNPRDKVDPSKFDPYFTTAIVNQCWSSMISVAEMSPENPFKDTANPDGGPFKVVLGSALKKQVVDYGVHVDAPASVADMNAGFNVKMAMLAPSHANVQPLPLGQAKARQALKRGDLVGAQEITSIATNLASGAIYAGTTLSGTIFVSRDEGATWSKLDSLAGAMSVSALAYNILTGAMYAATNTGEVFVITDGDTTIQRIGTVAGGGAITVLLADNMTGMLFAGTDKGAIAQSLDGGFSWKQVHAASGAITATVLDTLTHTVYFGTAAGKLEKTQDGGYTWQTVSLPTTAPITGITFSDLVGTVYVTTDAALYLSLNGGETWTTAALPAEAHAIMVSMDPVYQSLYISVSSPDVVYRSVDEGVVWTPLTIPAEQTIVASAGYFASVLHLIDDASAANIPAAEGVNDYFPNQSDCPLKWSTFKDDQQWDRMKDLNFVVPEQTDVFDFFDPEVEPYHYNSSMTARYVPSHCIKPYLRERLVKFYLDNRDYLPPWAKKWYEMNKSKIYSGFATTPRQFLINHKYLPTFAWLRGEVSTLELMTNLVDSVSGLAMSFGTVAQAKGGAVAARNRQFAMDSGNMKALYEYIKQNPDDAAAWKRFKELAKEGSEKMDGQYTNPQRNAAEEAAALKAKAAKEQAAKQELADSYLDQAKKDAASDLAEIQEGGKVTQAKITAAKDATLLKLSAQDTKVFDLMRQEKELERQFNGRSTPAELREKWAKVGEQLAEESKILHALHEKYMDLKYVDDVVRERSSEAVSEQYLKMREYKRATEFIEGYYENATTPSTRKRPVGMIEADPAINEPKQAAFRAKDPVRDAVIAKVVGNPADATKAIEMLDPLVRSHLPKDVIHAEKGATRWRLVPESELESLKKFNYTASDQVGKVTTADFEKALQTIETVDPNVLLLKHTIASNNTPYKSVFGTQAEAMEYLNDYLYRKKYYLAEIKDIRGRSFISPRMGTVPGIEHMQGKEWLFPFLINGDEIVSVRPVGDNNVLGESVYPPQSN